MSFIHQDYNEFRLAARGELVPHRSASCNTERRVNRICAQPDARGLPPHIDEF
jgi:hypothetical protein